MAKIDEIKMLRLGQRDENLARSLTFDCSDWLEQYPEASIHILFRRPGESAIVPMSTTLEGTTLTWLIHDFEVGKTGVGNAEFRAVDTAGLRRKSRIIPCSIEETLLGDDETVLYTQDQVDETLAHISEAAQAAQAAQASEEAAALSAQEAGESATSASTAADVAVSARDAAQAAQTAAETAQHQAEAAQSGVHADAEAAEQAKVAAQAAQAGAQGAAFQASADRTAAESARADAEAAATHAEAVVEGIDQAGADQVAAVNAAGQAQVTAVNQAGTTQVGNVNAAGTTQVNAVQAKGTQVINSIPADYSALTDDVTDLKSALDYNANLSEEINKTDKTTTWAQGKLSGASAYHIRSGYINLVSGDIIGVKNSLKYAFEVGEYDSSGTMLELSDTTNLFVADRDMRIRLQLHDTNPILSILPAAGTNVLFTHNDAEDINQIPQLNESLSILDNRLDAVDEETGIIASMVSVLPASCTEFEGAFYSNGNIIENANWNAKKVYTNGEREFIVSVNTSLAAGAVYVMTFCRNDGTVISTLYPLNADAPTIKNMLILVPESTDHFYINSYQTQPVVYQNSANEISDAIQKIEIAPIKTIADKIYYPTTNAFVDSIAYDSDVYLIDSNAAYYFDNTLNANVGFYSILYFSSIVTFDESTYISAEYGVIKSKTTYPNVCCPLHIPSGAKCIMLVYSKSDPAYKGVVYTDFKPFMFASPLYGKNITVIGDSITEYNYRAGINWAMWISKWAGCKVQNLGISGTGFMRSNPYVNRITNIESDCDIIGVAASLNDLSGGSVIGTPTDTQQDNTVLGYANTFFTTLQSSYPSTPIICYMENPWEAYHSGVERSDDYVNGIAQVCRNHGIPFYPELYTNGCVLRPWVYQNRLVYFTSDNENYPDQMGIVDNVHPNTKGMDVIARYLIGKFEQNILS